VIMTPLLEGTDGAQKMSKSLENYIGINEPASEIFGKLMSISDELMYKYFECLTDFDLKEIKALHPKEAKQKLGVAIVEQFYNRKEAEKVNTDFEGTFSQGKVPTEVEEYRLGAQKANLAEILFERGLVVSTREFQRLLKQGAISHNGDRLTDARWTPKAGVLKVGKRRFLKLV